VAIIVKLLIISSSLKFLSKNINKFIRRCINKSRKLSLPIPCSFLLSDRDLYQAKKVERQRQDHVQKSKERIKIKGGAKCLFVLQRRK